MFCVWWDGLAVFVVDCPFMLRQLCIAGYWLYVLTPINHHQALSHQPFNLTLLIINCLCERTAEWVNGVGMSLSECGRQTYNPLTAAYQRSWMSGPHSQFNLIPLHSITNKFIPFIYFFFHFVSFDWIHGKEWPKATLPPKELKEYFNSTRK